MALLLFHGYASSALSRRKFAQATHDSIAFGFICVSNRLDHCTIADFRERFLDCAPGRAGPQRIAGQQVDIPMEQKRRDNAPPSAARPTLNGVECAS